MDERMFCHRRFVLMSKPYVPVEFFYSSLYRSKSLSYVPLNTLTRYAVNHRSLQSQVVLNWTKETGDFPRRQSNVCDIVFGQHSAEPAVSPGHLEKE
jgi:hypothetical protein